MYLKENARRSSHVDMTMKKLTVVKMRKKEKFSVLFGMLASLHSAKDNKI